MNPGRALVVAKRIGTALALLALEAASPASLAQSPTPQAGAVSPPRIGRLFFTPQQRQDLERRRALNIVETVSNEGSWTVNGQVTRSSGKTTTWVNEAPEHDTTRPGDPAVANIQTRDGEPSVPLRIGQTLDPAKGEVTDGLGGGEVKIQRRGGNAR